MNNQATTPAQFSVFYFTGGYLNRVCRPVIGKFSFEEATEKVALIKNQGFKAIIVKNSH